MTSIKPQSSDISVLKQYIFDPLSTIIKLVILGNKISGCKISLKDNIISIQEAGITQSIKRYYFGKRLVRVLLARS